MIERWRELEARAGLGAADPRRWREDADREAERKARAELARARLGPELGAELEALDVAAQAWLACRGMAERARTSAARYAARAQAARERWARLATCGAAWELRRECAEHGELDAAGVPVRCGHVRLCVTCRGVRAQIMRARVSAWLDVTTRPGPALATLRRDRRTAGVVPPRGLEALLTAAATAPARDRWGVRFVTLTVPHWDARRDVKAALDAYAGLARRVRDHYRGRGHATFGAIRVLEVTPGTDESGHAHIHAVWWGPFVRAELVRVWWGQELRRRGYAVPTVDAWEVLTGTAPGCTTAGGAERRLAELAGRSRGGKVPGIEQWTGRRYECPARLPWPVIDVRRVTERPEGDGEINRRDLAEELVKYLVKDLGPTIDDAGTRERAAPELMAAIYEATEGRRLIVASAGVWAAAAAELGPREVCTCSVCGALPQYAARRVVHLPGASRAPPETEAADG